VMKKIARSVFTFSLSYLFVIFLALMTDRVAQVVGWI
jgi:protoheme IX farnesyltransferase